MIDNPWFVRTGSGITTQIRPRGPKGWLLTLAYAVATCLLANGAAHAGPKWMPYVAMILSLTGIFLTTIWWLSVFEPRKGANK